MSENEESGLLTVEQAIAVIDQTPVFPRALNVPLEQSAGLRLAEDLKADRDFPPFRKSMMDGYAVRAADVSRGSAELRVVGEIAAGKWPDVTLGAGEAMAIMTGAPLPYGADGVVPVEDVEARVPVGLIVRIVRAKSPERFVAARGSDCHIGQTVLTRGTLIGPAQIAVAASIGAANVSCFARPHVAVLGTGDELVPIDETPGPAQIRDSNTPMLAALLRKLGCDVVDISSVADDPKQIAGAIQRAMAYDALFIAGGMSMGEYDYVPRLLVELGVEMKITKLRIKPGKPFVFGVGRGGAGETERWRDGETERQRDERPEDSSLRPSIPPSRHPSTPPSLHPSTPPLLPPSFIFGLPGNPVSAFVCTLRLASRLLTRIAGGEVEERWMTGRLTAGLAANGPREFYQPAICKILPGRHSGQSGFASITPLQWKGSADLFTLASANVLIVRAENEPAIASGSIVRVLEMNP